MYIIPKKYRATVPVIESVAAELDTITGNYVEATSVKSAFETMVDDLGFPKDGESGMKLIRRSMGNLLRERLPSSQWGEIELFMGHDRINDVTDLYAPLRPDYLANAKLAIQAIANEIEKAAPGAFYRNLTTAEPILRAVAGGKNG